MGQPTGWTARRCATTCLGCACASAAHGPARVCGFGAVRRATPRGGVGSAAVRRPRAVLTSVSISGELGKGIGRAGAWWGASTCKQGDWFWACGPRREGVCFVSFVSMRPCVHVLLGSISISLFALCRRTLRPRSTPADNARERHLDRDRRQRSAGGGAAISPQSVVKCH